MSLFGSDHDWGAPLVAVQCAGSGRPAGKAIAPAPRDIPSPPLAPKGDLSASTTFPCNVVSDPLGAGRPNQVR